MGSHKVLKSSSEVDDVINQLRSLDLFAHHDQVKSWDTHDTRYNKWSTLKPIYS